jgi:hypothetical protein
VDQMIAIVMNSTTGLVDHGNLLSVAISSTSNRRYPGSGHPGRTRSAQVSRGLPSLQPVQSASNQREPRLLPAGDCPPTMMKKYVVLRMLCVSAVRSL